MRRRMFDFAALLSLLLFLVTVALWARSYWIGDAITHFLSGPEWPRGQMTVVSGMFYYGWREIAPPGASRGFSHQRQRPVWVWRYNSFPVEKVHMPWGLVFVQERDAMHFDAPLAIPAVLAAILPYWRLRLARRQKIRRIRGRCLVCGFDLTGNVSGTCPECGTAMAGKAET